MKKWKIVLGGFINLCVFVGIGVVFYFAYQLGFQAFANESSKKEVEEVEVITVEVTEGQGSKEIGSLLVEKGILDSSVPFIFRYVFSEYRGEIKPGTYEISETMGIDDILKVLSQMDTQ